jgi:hypothetical protein
MKTISAASEPPSWPATPVLLGVARVGADGVVELPERIRREAGIEPGGTVLLARAPGSLGGLLLLDAVQAARNADTLLSGLAGLREALCHASEGEEDRE